MKRPAPRDEVWDRYLKSCAPLVRSITNDLRDKACQRNRKDDAEDLCAIVELEIADYIERNYLKETP